MAVACLAVLHKFLVKGSALIIRPLSAGGLEIIGAVAAGIRANVCEVGERGGTPSLWEQYGREIFERADEELLLRY